MATAPTRVSRDPYIQVTYEIDDQGTAFPPSRCAHAYGYDVSGNLATDTATDVDGVIRKKTFTYSGGNVATASAWVVQ